MPVIRFDDLPDDMQVLIVDLVCQTIDTQGQGRDNGRTVPDTLPLLAIPTECFPVVELDPFDRGPDHARAMDLDSVPPVLVADGQFLDGRHRTFQARETGRDTLTAIDLTDIADPTMIEANAMGFLGDTTRSFSR